MGMNKAKVKLKRHLQIPQWISVKLIWWNDVATHTIKYDFGGVYAWNHPTYENDFVNAIRKQP